MNRSFFLKATPTLLILTISANLLLGWGIWGHRHINRAAVFALPEKMRLFYYNHIDFITEESVIPDVRKYTMNDKAEFPRHYIDLEAFGDSAADRLPRTPAEAYKQYNADTLRKYGILPWYIQEMMQKLTSAFQQRNRAEILLLSADLGHYLADANMPLHTSLNHNGQLTGQTGIHGFWESQLPEMFGHAYRFKVEPAHYLENIPAATWNIIRHSHSLADTLLEVDRKLKLVFPEDKIYKKDTTGKRIRTKYGDPVFSDDYAAAYHTALHGMVENQLRHAIQDITNCWYTAWVNAGQPDLTSLDDPALMKANAVHYREEIKLMEEGKLFGMEAGQKEY